MSAPVYDRVYADAVYVELLADPEVYGEDPLADTSGPTTAADAVTVSSTATRAVVLVRSASDAFTITDSADTASMPRAVSDVVTATDAATQNRSIVRSASDAVTVSGTVSRTLTASRTTADTITLSSAAAALRSLSRTAANTVTLSSAITDIRNIYRTAFDTSFIGGAARAANSNFTPSLGGGGGGGGGGGVGGILPNVSIVITIGGIDVTSRVHLTKSEFISQVNGQFGTCSIAIKDPSLIEAFAIGSRIVLKINDLRVWSGYLMKIDRTYPFPAFSPPSVRNFVLVGLEIGVLFQRRIVNRKASPTVAGPTYPSHTQDTTVFADLFPDFLDLDLDGIDTTSYVTHVGTINEDQTGNPIVCGSPWAETMRQMSRLTNPVWYINADRQLVWADVDVETAPFGISDNPNSSEIGVRDLSISFDATAMANDVLLIGSGGGSPNPVYDRDIDSVSVAEHGTWQAGSQVVGVWKQNTIDRLANAWVDGNPQSRRGHKDDRVFANCTTFEPGLRAGMVVDLRSEVWDFRDNIPIRQMRVSWPVHSQTKYELLLSHELDSYSLFDPYKFPPYSPGGFPVYHPPKIIFPPPVIVEPPPGGCSDAVCGITDTFTRTTSNGSLGTSDAGYPWTVFGSSSGISFTPPTIDVNGSAADVLLPAHVSTSNAGGTITPNGPSFDLAATHSIQFSLSTLGDPALAAAELIEIRFSIGTGLDLLHVLIIPSNSSLWLQGGGLTPTAPSHSQITWTSDRVSGTVIPLAFWSAGTTYTVSWYASGGVFYGAITDGSATYTVGNVSGPSIVNAVQFSAIRSTLGPFDSSVGTHVYFDNLTIPEITRCTAVQFENFNRTDASEWGNATPSGYLWQTTQMDGTWSVSNGAGGPTGSITIPGGLTKLGAVRTSPSPSAPWMVTTGWTLRTVFRMDGTLFTRMTIGVFDSVSNHYSMQVGLDYIAQEFLDQDNNSVPMTLTNGVYYAIEFNVVWTASASTKTWRARAWKVGTAQPDWQISGSGGTAYPDANAALFTSIVGHHPSTGDTGIWRYIDFDYETRPCYIGCGTPTTLDDFNRSGSSGWGTATSGSPWVVTSSPTSVFSVDGSSGVITASSGTPSIQITDALLGGNAWEMNSRFATGLLGGGLRSIRYEFIGPGIDRSIYFNLSASSGSLEMDTVSGSASFNFLSSSSYDFRASWDVVTGEIKAKVWLTGGAEPDWMRSGFWGPGSGEMTTLAVSQMFTSASYTHHIDYIEITPCGIPTPPTISVSTPSTGQVCENFDGGLGSYQLSANCYADTVQVYLDGILTPGATATTAGLVDIGFASIIADNVMICYEVRS